ncbi:hypothetical protein [Enterococcus durans]|uniref:hypothetical protein n=1 Tax=Enterococcus durans TaxID=53345 RepID=UPI00197BDC15|nr:hypothetical protein [Enterococcus durans]
MTKWIVSTPLKGTDLMKNFVCFTEVELQKLLEQYPEAIVEMKDSHLEDYIAPQLNDNQKIVLEWLEEYYAKSQWPFPFYVLKHAANDMPANIFGFYDDFTMKEEFEVLAAFAQWGLEQEEAG